MKYYILIRVLLISISSYLPLTLMGNVPASDSLALVSLYNATNGASWSNNANWLSGPVDTWHGVTVENDTVKGVSLSFNNITGTLPSDLDQFSGIETLAIYGNPISGSIPQSIGNILSLRVLDLRHNQLNDSLPTSLTNLINLEELLLAGNQISGEIITGLDALNNLRVLDLSNNDLNGVIPSDIGNVSGLEDLYLSDNNLTGPIPTSIGNLSNLRFLYLGNNPIGGTIPIEINDLTSLQKLGFYNMELVSPIPTELADLTNLNSLLLYNNQFNEPYPEFINGLTGLTELYLSNNQFFGPIPSSIDQLINLETFQLSYNQFDGNIPVSIGSLSNLRILYLSENQLSGVIPGSLSGLSNLEALILRNNNLEGDVMGIASNLSELQSLVIEQNNFGGPIPASLGALTNLSTLWISYNNFSGPIPDSLVSLPNLSSLVFDSNDITYLPDFSSKPSIYIYSVNNQLTFESLEPNISLSSFYYNPQSFFGIPLDTSVVAGANVEFSFPVGGSSNIYEWWKDGNIVSDSATLSLSSVTPGDAGTYQLRVTNSIVTGITLFSEPVTLQVDSGGFDLQSDSLALVALYNATDGPNWVNNTNWLSGPLDTWYGVSVSNDRVNYLFLGNNDLNGVIPPELGNLDQLQQLGLERNQLTGGIPAEIGNLGMLEYLNLNWNPFSGVIPEEISNLINLWYLDISSPTLSGPIPDGLWDLVNLTNLAMSGVSINDSIPNDILNLVNLTNLSMSSCGLIGEIPSEINQLTNLSYIWLMNNNLSGELPASIGQLTELRNLYLGNNQLSGDIPEEIANLTQLVTLVLGPNNFTGPIPSGIWDMGDLQVLAIGNNELTGEIPPEVGNLTQLFQFTIYGNHFTGDIPDEITNISGLQRFEISYNEFTSIPDLTGLSLLNNAYVQNNKLTFSDLEENISLSTFIYSPQDSIGESLDTLLLEGTGFSLPISVSGSANQYQWFKDGSPIAGATDSTLILDPVILSDSGIYHLEVTNTIVADLTLVSRLIRISIQQNSCVGNYQIESQEFSCASSSVFIPISAINDVNGDVIGLDFCLTYDTSLLIPTGNANIGAVAHSGDPGIVDMFLNTSIPGQINGLVYFNSSAPFPTFFSGSGNVISLEFVFNGDVAPGTDIALELCGVTESALYSGTYDHCNEVPSIQQVINDPTFTGTLKFWNRNGRRLLYDSLNPGNYIPTLINGTDSLCQTIGSKTFFPDLNGQFIFETVEGDYFEINRDIPGAFEDTLGCTNVMSWINGTDQNRALRIATMDPNFTPSAYQIIAADVNQDGLVNAADITLIAARSVMNICGFSSDGINSSDDWLFIDETTFLSDPSFIISTAYPGDDGVGYSKNNVPLIPECLPVPKNIQGSCGVTMAEDYIAILLGDVNGNWNSAAGSTLRPEDNPSWISFDFEGMRFENGYYYLPLIIEEMEVEAIDFYFDFNNENVEIEEVIVLNDQLISMENIYNGSRLLFSSYFIEQQQVSGPFIELKLSPDVMPTNDDFKTGLGIVNDQNIVIDEKAESDSQIGDNWLIYPNPFESEILIQFGKDEKERVDILLLDMNGKKLLHEQFANTQNVIIDLNGVLIEKGMYLLQINTESGSILKKVLKN